MKRRSLTALAAALALTAPWVVVWAALRGLPRLLRLVAPEYAYTPPAGIAAIPTIGIVLLSGTAVLGASFLLAWAAETAEKDVPRSFAIAVLAVLAVAPEYAVDGLYAWNAGKYAGTARGVEAGNLAVANMTGANRILIGIGWAGIALFTVYRVASVRDPAVSKRDGFMADAVQLDRAIGLEVVFLLAATAWAFLVPIGDGIDALDMVVLVGIYVAYILVVLRGDVDPDSQHIGVPAYLQTFPRGARVATVVSLFAYAGLMIFIAVEPFAHGLESLGTALGVPPFFMIQWIAPLASESPELIVVVYLVNKARSTAGFNALISSKLNQWTLLIGTLVVVHSLALGRYGALAFDAKQSAEIWLTAAQSLFAIAVLVNFEITVRESVVILVLFLSQVVLEFLIIQGVDFPLSAYELLLAYSAVYVVLAAGLFVVRRRSFRGLLRDTGGTISRAAFPDGESAPSSDD